LQMVSELKLALSPWRAGKELAAAVRAIIRF
jgi:hypothetical protein